MSYGPYILIEGPDGCGKTTLARRIHEETGWPIEHCGPPDKPAWIDALNKSVKHNGPVIFDRSHASGVVYGLAFRGAPESNDYESFVTDGWFASRGALSIYCSVPDDVADKNLERGPIDEAGILYESMSKRGEVRRLYWRYFNNELCVKYNLRVPLFYDYTKMPIEDVVNYVKRWAAVIDERPEIVAAGNFVNPRWVIVGYEDEIFHCVQRRARLRGLDFSKYRRLYMSYNPGRSCALFNRFGRFFLACLRAAHISLSDLFIVNVKTLDCDNNLYILNEARPIWFDRDLTGGRPEIVALGSKAEEELAKLEMRVDRVVPTPAYWYKYHYHSIRDYAAMITAKDLRVDSGD